MNFLFIGELHEFSRGYQRRNILRKLGHSVDSYPIVCPKLKLDSKPNFLYRVLWRLGYPPDTTNVNKNLLRSIQSEKYSVIWIEKGNTIKPFTLEAIKKFSPQSILVSYSEDDMFISSNRSIWYTKGLKYYDVVFTTKSHNLAPCELNSIGARRVIFVGKAYDSSLHRPLKVSNEERVKFGSDVGFIGTYEDERAKSMEFLAEHDIKIRVWGSGWNNKRLHKNIICEKKPLYGDDYIKALCSTKINLAFLRKANRDLQTDRSVEIPACKGFMLAERTVEHMHLFEEGKEAEYFSSDCELLEKVVYYLINEGKRESIANAGRERCIKSGYSHDERLAEMISRL